jgi:hypothetical protein
MRPPQPDAASDGWLRILPAVASRVYLNTWFLHFETGSPLPGDLDDPEAADWIAALAPTGLDEPYDPARDPGLDDGWRSDEEELERWQELQRYASERDLPMTTSRHVIEFMLELGLIERRETDDGLAWVIASPLPNVEDVLNLSPERLEQEAKVRWELSFAEVERTIAAWIGELRTPGTKSHEFTTSIQAVAEELRLDPEDARHGLTILLSEDIRCDIDPETAAVDAPLRLTIDWKLFEDFRTLYGPGPLAEKEFGG